MAPLEPEALVGVFVRRMPLEVARIVYVFGFHLWLARPYERRWVVELPTRLWWADPRDGGRWFRHEVRVSITYRVLCHDASRVVDQELWDKYFEMLQDYEFPLGFDGEQSYRLARPFVIEPEDAFVTYRGVGRIVPYPEPVPNFRYMSIAW